MNSEILTGDPWAASGLASRPASRQLATGMENGVGLSMDPVLYETGVVLPIPPWPLRHSFAILRVMAKRRRKRIRYYAGGAVLLCLLFYLGDPTGLFQPGGMVTVGGAADSERAASVDRRGQQTDPDSVEEVRLASGPPDDETARRSGAVVRTSADGVPVNRLATSTAGERQESETGTLSLVTRLDAALGMIEELERALRSEDLAELARLQDGLRQQPLNMPPELETRWQSLQGRVESALACAPRLRELVRRGQVLAARAILAPLRNAKTPAWMRADLDRATQGIGWPALGRSYQVEASSAVAGGAFDKHRQVRCWQNGRILQGRVWINKGRQLTVRVSGAAGYTYPIFDLGDVEPVAATPDEALRQGLAAVEKADVDNLLLWCCYLHEVGAESASLRLRKLLK
ncbi:MAG: hypothetical protein VX951_12230 [Planctomycetota bacterium]|nr:hypothetical protein [Planctomycetota bacterium]